MTSSLAPHQGTICALIMMLIGGCGGDSNSLATVPELTELTAERLWQDDGFGLAAADEVVNGVYIATDYVYDDKGPNTEVTPGGDSTYPQSDAPYFNNAADLVEVRIGALPGADSLLVGVRFNTVVDTSVPVAAIGVADGGAPELSESWPFGAGVSATGVRFVLTLRDSEATLTDLTTGDNTALPITIYNDTGEDQRYLENTYTAIVPLSAFGLESPPDRNEWQIHAIAGLWNGNAWSEAPFDLAFFADSFTNWQQDGQADVLAGGDISTASATVAFTDFPTRAVPTHTGQQARIYPSPASADIGEGIVPWVQRIQEDEIQTLNHYRGLYLPYSVWIPHDVADVTRPLPLFLFLHGASQNHLGMLNDFESGSVNVLAYTVAPLGAGELSFYKEEGELDVLSVMKDFMAHYPTDDNRVFLSGLSMGGQGTFSVGTHWPDKFAAAIPFIGTGQSTFNEDVPVNEVSDEKHNENRWMNSTGREVLENAYNLPWRMQNGAADPVVNPSWPLQDVARMEELQNDHQFALFYTSSHNVIPEYQNALYHQVIDGCASGAAAGCDAELDPGGITRDINPARVIYKVVPFHFTERLGLIYDSAYWVSGMAVRDTPIDASFGLIDVTSFALAQKLRTEIETIGPSPAQVFAPTNGGYDFQGIRQSAGEAQSEPRIMATLTNLAAVSLDLSRAGLTAMAGEKTIEITTDGDTILTLTGLTPLTAVTVNDLAAENAGDQGVYRTTIPAGEHFIYLVD